MTRGSTGSADLAAVFLRWTWWRAALHRGWWLLTSVYLVVDAGLSPSQLVLIGVGQAIVGLGFELPTGVVADTISRKWSLVVSHALMGSAMIATGLVAEFPAVLATQMLWGLSWAFASGADVAWITDELGADARIAHVLMRSGRADLTGAAVGIVAIGALGSLLARSTAMILAGSAMLLLGGYVVVRFREARFAPARQRRWAASWSIFARGTVLVRRSRGLFVMLTATLLVNGAWVGFGRLQPRRLVDLGLPTDPVAWFVVLSILTLLAGATAFAVVERRVRDGATALRAYGGACAVGAGGAIVLALAPEELTGSAAVLLVAGIAIPLTRTLAAIYVNEQTSSETRATVHSFLAQAEYVGEIACGLALAVVARVEGLSLALAACGALFVLAMAVTRVVR